MKLKLDGYILGPMLCHPIFFKRKSVSHLNHEPSFGAIWVPLLQAMTLNNDGTSTLHLIINDKVSLLMSEQPASCSLICGKGRSSYCKIEEMQTNSIAKVMLNKTSRVYTATIIDVSVLTIIW